MKLKVENLTKKFKKIKVLNNLNISIESNGIYCLLGRNGAGKTTLLKIISGYIPKYEGNIYIDNIKIPKGQIPKNLCFIEEKVKQLNKPIKELYKISSTFYENWDYELANELSEKFNLDLNQKFKKLSFGMQTITNSIIALCSNSKITLLDEPMLGFDSILREQFYESIIESYQRSPKLIIISTHLIDEIANYCEKVMIMNSGKIILNETIENINEKSFSIIGEAKEVENAIKDLNILSKEYVSNYMHATLYDENTQNLTGNFNIEKISLQKLFGKMVGGKTNE
ncbi:MULTISPECIES: ATP-binding cassette domain-containing protein [Oceanotoga]|uniref:ABC-2 type transport system ATP-binding protein n=1 Tax=Oceanotoga teriensis TaxID=515440 RepID=A0AA45C6R3_9BACT|nr:MULTISPECIES: ABC transporter ATP-binding protein [Oceanotoga]MDN5342208.1 type transport system ATP-binding protein [Oceanotoga sp.]MDO7977232.1 ABC transporter ATP-binding protein [Oceanotoga teriensis]PWJ93222.1 ABC-2 type transport system ATP-binding protein [Oceanotoga teriensis]